MSSTENSEKPASSTAPGDPRRRLETVTTRCKILDLEQKLAKSRHTCDHYWRKSKEEEKLSLELKEELQKKNEDLDKLHKDLLNNSVEIKSLKEKYYYLSVSHEDLKHELSTAYNKIKGLQLEKKNSEQTRLQDLLEKQQNQIYQLELNQVVLTTAKNKRLEETKTQTKDLRAELERHKQTILQLQFQIDGLVKYETDMAAALEKVRTICKLEENPGSLQIVQCLTDLVCDLIPTLETLKVQLPSNSTSSNK